MALKRARSDQVTSLFFQGLCSYQVTSPNFPRVVFSSSDFRLPLINDRFLIKWLLSAFEGYALIK